ncbi:MAG: glycogen synthase GlgA, partial [Gammaproteobacteria bacterium]
PRALYELDQDIRLIIPGYTTSKANAKKLKTIVKFEIDDLDVSLLECRLPGSEVITWLVDCPVMFERTGGPYLDEDGNEWSDNAERFALFCKAIHLIAMDQAGLGWQPEIVHCNDWQTGLVPVLLSQEPIRPFTVFTIHNLAYQGIFSYESFVALELPSHLWHHDALEFHGLLSFIKGGLVYADRITTVSPRYAEEIQTPEFGYGLSGLLQHRSDVLSGILNGIDTNEWDPGTDPRLFKNYDQVTLDDKLINKSKLQGKFNLPEKGESLLIGFIGRLVEQKGIDVILQSLRELIELPIQFALLGSGQRQYEEALLSLVESHPDKISIVIGYNEELAHQIEAGVDVFLMPSRFEPCGLNQLYSLRYGTLPIVTNVGGLSDSVIDTTAQTIKDRTATGIVIQGDSAQDLIDAVNRSVTLFQDKDQWREIMTNAMQQDFSWQHSAQQYLTLYNTL